jgi:hypothetical protein
MLTFGEAAVTFQDYTPYEGAVLHLLAGVRAACWLMATGVIKAVWRDALTFKVEEGSYCRRMFVT